MVKKKLNPLRIDFINGVIEDRLQQVRNVKDINQPQLVAVWTAEIFPKDSKPVINFIRLNLQKQDPVSFLHIKRIQHDKVTKKLKVIFCSEALFKKRNDLVEYMIKNGFDTSYENLIDTNLVPTNCPPSKELMVEWSEKFWPLNWSGNPNDQILNDYIFDMESIRKVLQDITDVSIDQKKAGNKFPIVTAFVNPNDSNSQYLISKDERSEENWLGHSIMNGIKRISEAEKFRRSESTELTEKKNYLCYDFDIYTTHEPCSMCAMALIHSRVKRVIFIKQMYQTGCLKNDSGMGYCMHDIKALNSSYEVFQWIGDEYSEVPNISSNVCC